MKKHETVRIIFKVHRLAGLTQAASLPWPAARVPCGGEGMKAQNKSSQLPGPSTASFGAGRK
eukprot:scaffold276_cov116-Isochrysis_galbana.AAC.18